MMKLFSILALALMLVSSATALAPAHNDRRAFLAQVAATSAVAVTTSAPAFAANYDLDVGDIVVPVKEAPKKSSDAGGLVGGALAGGLLLSLPFFYQNLARMAGIKNAKLK